MSGRTSPGHQGTCLAAVPVPVLVPPPPPPIAVAAVGAVAPLAPVEGGGELRDLSIGLLTPRHQDLQQGIMTHACPWGLLEAQGGEGWAGR